MLESLFNKVAGLTKKRPQQRCFSVNNAEFLRRVFKQNTSGDCFWIWPKQTSALYDQRKQINIWHLFYKHSKVQLVSKCSSLCTQTMVPIAKFANIF